MSMAEFFGYAVDRRLAPLWLPFESVRARTASPSPRTGHSEHLRVLEVETPLTNIDEAHLTRNYRWWTAAGARG